MAPQSVKIAETECHHCIHNVVIVGVRAHHAALSPMVGALCQVHTSAYGRSQLCPTVA